MQYTIYVLLEVFSFGIINKREKEKFVLPTPIQSLSLSPPLFPSPCTTRSTKACILVRKSNRSVAWLKN